MRHSNRLNLKVVFAESAQRRLRDVFKSEEPVSIATLKAKRIDSLCLTEWQLLLILIPHMTPVCKLKFCLLLPATVLLQGCVPVVTGMVTYHEAVSTQEHAAYADYLIDAQAKNKALEQTGQTPRPIMPEVNWTTDVYEPRLEYADYYTETIDKNALSVRVLTYEEWKETEYPKILAQRAAHESAFRSHVKRD